MSSLGRKETKFAQRLARIVANDPFTSVNFNRWGIGDDGVRRLITALHGNTVVVYIGLRDNSISAVLVSALVGTIENSSTLEMIDLEGNQFGVEGARAVARFLSDKSSVDEIVLNDCDIGAEGARVLAEALPNNSSITRLWLARNNIGDVGARLLVKALLMNSSVTYLKLEDNDISEELVQLVDALAEINAGASNPQEALGLKIEWLINLDVAGAQLLGLDERGAKEKAVSLVLESLDSFVEVEQRRGLFGHLLGSPEHGETVVKSVEIAAARTLYRYAAECGAAPLVLMNIVRAHGSLCTCRDVKHKLYPVMLLATMSEAGVDDVMEVLKMDPTIVRSGIFQTVTDNKRKRESPMR